MRTWLLLVALIASSTVSADCRLWTNGEQHVEVGTININTATLDQLQLLYRVGPVLAQRIIEYRETTPFESVQDFDNVKGIGPSTMNANLFYISIEGETHLTEKVKRPDENFNASEWTAKRCS